MAKDIKIIFSGDISRADAAIKSLERSGQQAASILEREFNQLGIKSAQSFDNQRIAADKAYDRIKSSGLATSSELERAEKAHSARMLSIHEAEHGKRIALGDKLKTHWLAITAAIAAGWATANKAITLAQEGAAFQAQGTSFANLAAASGISADKMVADLRRVSGETVSVQQLVEKAGTAMLLGVEATAIPKLAEIAKASSRITGQTVTEAFGDLSLAVARQSKMILDNLGIMVNVEKANEDYAASLGKTSAQLTDAERKQAFLNATMAEGQEIIEKVGKQSESDADKMAKFSASIDNIGKSLGILLSGPMASLADEMSATVGWLEAYKSGQIGFWEWATTGADSAAEKLKSLRLTNLDAGVTAEGQALALRKIEENAKKEAEAEAKSKAELKKIADEKAAKEREKELAAILKHNDRIVDIEKKRLNTSLGLEEAHLKKVTAAYEAADKARDSLSAARTAVNSQFSDAKNILNPVADQDDPYLKRLSDLDSLAKKEEEINSDLKLSAEEKARKLAALATEAATYDTAVILNGIEVISQLDAKATALETISRLQRESAQALAAETLEQEEKFNKSGAAMLAAEESVRSFKDEVSALDVILDGMNNKEINIIFKATGVEQILAASGLNTSRKYVTDESSPNFVGPTRSSGGLQTSDISTPFGAGFHTGTNYVPKSGLYSLARGEQVLNRNEASNASAGGNTVTIAPVINLSGVSANGSEKTARELAREIEPELRKLAGRYR